MATEARIERKLKAAASSLIVIVDSDASSQKSLRAVLESNGYAVQTAATGEEALQVLREARPAVLILEVEIPGMSGYDLCHIVKRNQRLQNVPVIFLTDDASPRAYRTGYDAGAAAFMAKPYKPEQLVTLVTSLAQMPLPAE